MTKSPSIQDSKAKKGIPTVHLEYLDESTIAVLTLDDPLRANAMSPEMADVFVAAVRQIEKQSKTRAVIIRGAGKDFSIGGHRDMLMKLGQGDMPETELREYMLGFYDRWLSMLDLDVPLISAMQGDCIGVAPVFACVPDIALADESLNLQVTFAGLALYPGMGLPYLLARKVGPAQAGRLMMGNLPISGREAEAIGLVERCVPSGSVFDEALKLAREISASHPATVRLLKSKLRLQRSDLQEELERNASQQAADFQTDHYRQRIAHYLPSHYE